MCGHDWCSVRISKEIQAFHSGKAEGFQRDRVIKSPALTPEQVAIVEQRGYLTPEEIHGLATKTRRAVGADAHGGSKAGCHSDVTDDASAKRLQHEKLAQSTGDQAH